MHFTNIKCHLSSNTWQPQRWRCEIKYEIEEETVCSVRNAHFEWNRQTHDHRIYIYIWTTGNVACHHVRQQRNMQFEKTCVYRTESIQNYRIQTHTICNCVKHSGSNVNFALNNNHSDLLEMAWKHHVVVRCSKIERGFRCHECKLQAYTLTYIGGAYQHVQCEMRSMVDNVVRLNAIHEWIHTHKSPQALANTNRTNGFMYVFFFCFYLLLPFIGSCCSALQMHLHCKHIEHIWNWNLLGSFVSNNRHFRLNPSRLIYVLISADDKIPNCVHQSLISFSIWRSPFIVIDKHGSCEMLYWFGIKNHLKIGNTDKI